MDVTDPGGYQRELEGALDRLDDAVDAGTLTDEEATALRQFGLERRTDLAASSVASYLRGCRIVVEKLGDVDLLELDDEAYRTIIGRLNVETDLSDASVANYGNALQAFHAWYGEEQLADVSWESDTHGDDVDPEEMLKPEDIKALRDAAIRARDVALVEFFADTGARRQLAASLRIADIYLDESPPTFRPNPEASGLKGIPQRRYPLIDSPAAIRNYLRTTHPRPETPEAALFHRIPGTGANPDGGDGWDDAGALAGRTITSRLTELGREAGLEKPTNPHNFRHSAVARMKREDYNREEIAHRVGWADAESEMFGQYGAIGAEELNADIARKAGLVVDGDSPERSRHPCGQCHEPLGPSHDYCPNCGAAVSRDAREAVQSTETNLLDTLTASDLSPRERKLVSELLQRSRAHEDTPPSRESS